MEVRYGSPIELKVKINPETNLMMSSVFIRVTEYKHNFLHELKTYQSPSLSNLNFSMV